MGEWLSGRLKICALVATSVRIRPLLFGAVGEWLSSGFRTRALVATPVRIRSALLGDKMPSEREVLEKVHRMLNIEHFSKQDIDDYIDETKVLK